MKKRYMSPEMRVFDFKPKQLLTTSVDKTKIRVKRGSVDLEGFEGYGGIDEDGEIDPD